MAGNETELGRAVVPITAKLDQLDKDLAAARQQLEKGLAGVAAQAGKTLTTVGKKMTVGLTLPLVALGTVAVNAASDLSESLNKVNVVFGQSSKIITDFSQNAARDLGMSTQAAYEATSTFGNLFTAMGIGQQPAADLSTNLVQLAADLASFNNLDPSDVLEKLRAGMVGEAMPLRTLGINLTAAATQAKAMQMGLADADGTLSNAALLQARYALIVEQSTNAQGDFARTSDGLANSTRIAKAELEDAAAKLGEKLIPLAKDGVVAIGNLADAFSSLDEPTQNFIVKLGLIAIAAGPVLTTLGKLAGLVSILAKVGAAVAAGGAATAAAGVTAEAALLGLLAKGEMEYQKFLDLLSTQLFPDTSKAAASELADLTIQLAQAQQFYNDAMERGNAEDQAAARGRVERLQAQIASLQEVIFATQTWGDAMHDSATRAVSPLTTLTNTIDDVTAALAQATTQGAILGAVMTQIGAGMTSLSGKEMSVPFGVGRGQRRRISGTARRSACPLPAAGIRWPRRPTRRLTRAGLSPGGVPSPMPRAWHSQTGRPSSTISTPRRKRRARNRRTGSRRITKKPGMKSRALPRMRSGRPRATWRTCSISCRA